MRLAGIGALVSAPWLVAQAAPKAPARPPTLPPPSGAASAKGETTTPVSGAAPAAAAAPTIASAAPASASGSASGAAVPVASPAVVSPASFACSSDEVGDLARSLASWASRYQEAEHAAFTNRGCDRSEVFCLNRLGEAVFDAPPARLRTGDGFVVEVILPVADSGKIAIATSAGAKAAVAAGPFEETTPPPRESPGGSSAPSCELAPGQRDTLKAAAASVARLAAHPGLEGLGIPLGAADDAYWMTSTNANIFADWAAWAASHATRVPEFTAVEAKVEIPFAEPTLDVEYARTERGSASPSVEQHYAVWIDSGQYHVEASVLVPFVFRGRRSATLTPTPSGSALQVGLDEDWHVTAAVMIDLFPFGRQKGQVSSFQHCRFGSCVENWLGLQFGTGLSRIFQEWYLGIVFEPVSGIALGAGATFLKGDFLQSGLAQGMLLSSPSDFSFKSDYMVRPYFGLALTTDLFQTIDRSSVFSRVW